MKPVIRHVATTAVALAAFGAAAFAVFVGSGVYNFAADDPHTAVVGSLLQTMRERSIATRARPLPVPDLGDTRRIVQGAGNYQAMCIGCHLAPGMGASELSRGLYPAPPGLARSRLDPAQAFWVVKHGVKASGMSAWGKSMSDEYLWNMVAFLQVLPTLDEAGYHGMVAQSGGHQHDGGAAGEAHERGEAQHHGGGGETDPHQEGGSAARAPQAAPTPPGATHSHADGSQHRHTLRPAAADRPPPGR